MTKEEHHLEAERLLKEAKSLLAASRVPDAAGSSIRKEWRRQALELFAEAQVHASFS